MVVTFEMLEGLTWSDGTPLTADDSVYSFEVWADPDTPASRYLVDRTTSYEATSDHCSNGEEVVQEYQPVVHRLRLSASA